MSQKNSLSYRPKYENGTKGIDRLTLGVCKIRVKKHSAAKATEMS